MIRWSCSRETIDSFTECRAEITQKSLQRASGKMNESTEENVNGKRATAEEPSIASSWQDFEHYSYGATIPPAT